MCDSPGFNLCILINSITYGAFLLSISEMAKTQPCCVYQELCHTQLSNDIRKNSENKFELLKTDRGTRDDRDNRGLYVS